MLKIEAVLLFNVIACVVIVYGIFRMAERTAMPEE